MSTANEPIICFGQQPNGIFPKRYFAAKIATARKLQAKIGGKIVLFYHDSDADYRETITLFHDPLTGADARLNFTQKNKVQKKYAPLYAKMVPEGWKADIANKLPRYVTKSLVQVFSRAIGASAADFCLDMYMKLGMLDGIEVVRSGGKEFRLAASDLSTDFFADVPYEGEIVRAEMHEGKLRLHEGGGNYFTIPTPEIIEKWRKNPGRDRRFAWMQSVIHCTHYISGAGEGAYLKKADFPDVIFVDRESIEDQDYAFLPKL